MVDAYAFACWVLSDLQAAAERVVAGTLSYEDALAQLAPAAVQMGRYVPEQTLADHLLDVIACIEAREMDAVEAAAQAAADSGVPRRVAEEIALASCEARLPENVVRLLVRVVYGAR